MKAKFFNVLCAAALLAGMGLSAQAAAAQTGKLVGTWRVTVTQHNCQTGAPVGMPFQSLLTFAPGGVMTETTANAMFFPADRGPGHGVWSSLGENRYRAESIAFITVNGALVKTQVITQGIHVDGDGDEFTSDAKVAFYDPSGALLMRGCAEATGHRFE